MRPPSGRAHFLLFQGAPKGPAALPGPNTNAAQYLITSSAAPKGPAALPGPNTTVIFGRPRPPRVGYLYNHLATVVCGAFAASLSILWWLMVPEYPLLNFVFIMAVPIAWFLVAMCWLAQKSTDYAHSRAAHGGEESPAIAAPSPAAEAAPDADELAAAREGLASELEALKGEVKLKDTEIARLEREISDLQTLVQIESLRAELANLKALAAKR